MDGLRIENVGVTYAGRGGTEVTALSQVDLGFARGEFVVAVGASGCGKTTLLSCIAGFMAPSEGHIFVNGRHVEGPGADRGVVFQKHALMPWLNVIDNVALGLRLRGLGRAERHEAALKQIRAVGLERYATHPVYQLSGGQQQRVGIARALAANPAMLLMDEPFGALDSLTREQVQELVLQIWAREGKLCFFITHDVEEALFLATELIVMTPSPGRVSRRYQLDFGRQYIAGGSARAIKSQPEFIRLREEVIDAIHAGVAVH
ncbi:taurine ABC transporter ATP-binding protein [uncultured Pseudacidovorax sp.]|uniref:taurine ABC transporter ATP-binding protein n=1 Tax=uncultured Pseudacidovorax sp. TaxID=679313 RepID=UPI0025CF0C88|nr:ATP-binding cassette domain-containing protein [uncultured Pseudacidovorax sp.]